MDILKNEKFRKSKNSIFTYIFYKFQINCKNGIDGFIFESVADFTDSSVSSNEATSDILEEEAVYKDDDNGKEVTNVDEFTKVTDNQDFMGASQEEKQFIDERKRGEELLIKPSGTSFTEGIDSGLSATVRDVAGRSLPVDTTGEAFGRCRRDQKKIKVVKVGDGIILLPDNGADRMAIREAANPCKSGERPKQSEAFGDKGSLKRLDVTLSRTAGDTTHARYIPVGSQPCDRSKEDANNKKEDAVFIEKGEADNEFTLSLDNEARCMVIPEGHALVAARESAKQSKKSNNQGCLERFEMNIPSKDDGGNTEEENTSDEMTVFLGAKILQMRIPETDAPYEYGEERISQSEEPIEQDSLHHLDVILSTAREITSMKDSTADFRPDGKTEDDFNTKKAENENSKGDKGKDVVKSSMDDEKNRTALFQDTRPLPQPKENTEEQQEMEGDGEQAVDFTVKDVLCFAWQIAKGMVSA